MNKLIYILILAFVFANQIDGQIGFTEELYEVAPPYTVGISKDINNDGIEDLVLGSLNSPVQDLFPHEVENNIEVYLKNISGEYELKQLITYDETHNDWINSIDLFDINNDQLNDLIIGFGNQLNIYLQKEDNQFTLYTSYQTNQLIEWVNCGDINRDSRQDIVLSGSTIHNIDILYQTDSLIFDTVRIEPESFGGINKHELVDINKDGLLDIVYIANELNGEFMYALLNDSVKGISHEATALLDELPYIECNSFTIADLNNDSLPDIITSTGSNATSKIIIYYQEENLFFSRVIYPVLDNPTYVKVTDLNNDGLKEICVFHKGWYFISILEQTEVEVFNEPVTFFSFYDMYSDDGWVFGKINDDDLIDILFPACGMGIGYLLFLFNNSDEITGIGILSGDSERSDIHFFPNPTSGNITLDFGNYVPKLRIKLINTLGQILYTREFHSLSNLKIDIPGPSGIYFLLIEIPSQKSEILKISKQ
jgi:hypothetical protein